MSPPNQSRKMSESPDATKYKRKRVAKACETCRIMKAKVGRTAVSSGVTL